MNDVVIPGGVLVVTLALIVGTLLALVAAVGIILRLLQMANEQKVRDITADRNSYRQIAEESLRQLERARNQMRALRGQGPFIPLVPVEAEHSSPVTPQQTETAHIATLRSRLVASVLDIDAGSDDEDDDIPPTEDAR